MMKSRSAAALDGAIARADERKEGFITSYWAPSGLVGKYPVVMLTEPAGHDAAEWKRCITDIDCADSKINAWPVDTVITAFTKGFAERAPAEVLAYFNTRNGTNDTVARLMAWTTENQATGEDGALHFLKESKDVWSKWVPPEIAARIEAAL